MSGKSFVVWRADIKKRLATDFQLAMIVAFGLVSSITIAGFSVFRFATGNVTAGLLNAIISLSIIAAVTYALVTTRSRGAGVFFVTIISLGAFFSSWLLGATGLSWSYMAFWINFVLTERKIALIANATMLLLISLATSAFQSSTALTTYLITGVMITCFAYIFAKRYSDQQEQLRQSLSRAEAASQAKSGFLANMSHEIRTPMTAILGYADLLETGMAKDPQQTADAVKTIQSNGRHLLTIINDILDMSKIEAGQLAVEAIETDPAQIVEEVASLMRPVAISRGIDLRMVYDSPIPRAIRSDPTRLRQILLNLVGNAIKFTETGSVVIHVECDPPGERMSFRVVDTGVGMTETQRAAIARFEAFVQADSSTTRTFGGTGLGLRISNSLATMLGGGIEVASVAGEGSTFTVSISTGPLEGIELGTPAQASDLVDLAAAPLAVSVVSQSEQPPLTPLKGLRILLAEDGPDNQRLISFHLKQAGATITVADNGLIAAESIESAMPDTMPHVVLMDMQMPELDGYAATRRLRQGGCVLPIIALTAHAMAGERQKCLDAGCDDYLTKPIDKTRLIKTCEEWARKNAAAASHNTTTIAPA